MATLTNEVDDKRTAEVRNATSNTMVAGLFAGLVITLLMAVARNLGLTSLNIERGFGNLLLGQTGAGPWLLGFVLHLAISAFFALIYAEVFRRLHRTGPVVGAAFGLVHWLVAGLMAGVLPMLRTMPDTVNTPGFFAVNNGPSGIFLLFALHLLFGAIVGAIHQRVFRDVTTEARSQLGHA